MMMTDSLVCKGGVLMTLNDMFTLFIAGLALLLSLATFVFTIVTGPRLNVLIGDVIMLHYSARFNLFVHSNFTFFNEGAQPGALVELSGTILTADKRRSEDLRWIGFEKNEYIEEPGKAYRLFTKPLVMPQTIIVSGRAAGGGGAETMGICLVTLKPFELPVKADKDEVESYRLKLRGLIGPKLRRWCTTEVILQISSDYAQFLRDECMASESGPYEHSLILRRQNDSESRKSWGARLLRPPSQVFVALKSTSTIPTPNVLPDPKIRLPDHER
jgi:hypothetical protein